MSDENSIKIGMFGGGGVGKTCLTLRYLKGEYTDSYIPTIEDEFSKVIEVDNKPISLIVIDTAGQDDFSEMRFNYYSKVHAFVFVMDISNADSIDELKTIYNDAKDVAPNEIIGVIAANKADLRNEGRTDLVSVEEIKKLESELKFKVFETSAKANTNVDELFIYLVKQLLKKDKPQAKGSNDKKDSTAKKEKESGGEGGCCTIA